MIIKYISGESRNIVVNVNGKDVKTLSCNSGGWGTIGSKSLSVELEPGENVIRLYNKSSSSWMPNIDCMTLRPADNDRLTVGINRPAVQTVTTDNSFYTLDGRKVKNPTTKGIYIHKGQKVLK